MLLWLCVTALRISATQSHYTKVTGTKNMALRERNYMNGVFHRTSSAPRKTNFIIYRNGQSRSFPLAFQHESYRLIGYISKQQALRNKTSFESSRKYKTLTSRCFVFSLKVFRCYLLLRLKGRFLLLIFAGIRGQLIVNPVLSRSAIQDGGF